MLNSDRSEGTTEYGEIFDQRGKLYHQAMQAYPESRSQEFINVIAEADIRPGMTVVDVRRVSCCTKVTPFLATGQHRYGSVLYNE